MLVDRGLAKDNSARLYLQEVIPEITASDLDYTVHLFSQLAATVSGYAPGHRWASAATVLARRFAEIRREAATRALREVVLDALANGDRRLQETLFLQLLGKREFDLVETAAKATGCDPCTAGEEGRTFVHVLVSLGHASLLARIATQEHVKTLEDCEWRKNWETCGGMTPLVLEACRRDAPNMEVLRALVEKLNAST